MRINRLNNESGQAIVLIVLAIVALMGFVALSIDVGQAYSNRRTAQNASDASALAGAEYVSQTVKEVTDLDWNCGTLVTKNSGWYQAANTALTRATDNGFTIPPVTGVIKDLGGGKYSINYGIDTKNGVEIICAPDPYIDVHVMLTSKVQTSFMQFVNKGAMVNTVDTIVRVRPRVVYGNGATLLALKTSCDKGQKNGGIFLDGTVDVDVSGGDVVSNACIDKNGSSGDIDAGSNDITYHTTVEPVKKSGEIPGMDPQPTHSGGIIGVDAATLAAKLTEGCKSVANYGSPVKADVPTKTVKNLTIGPGNYSSITVGNGGTLTMTAGLYCIYGETSIKGNLEATDVTIFVPASGGNFKVEAGGNAIILAPKAGCDYDTPGCSPAIGGLAILFMPDDSAKKELWIQGNSDSTYRGTILAPNTIIDIGGNPDSDNIDAQIIGETIRIHGNGKLNINYKKDYAVAIPALMNLQK